MKNLLIAVSILFILGLGPIESLHSTKTNSKQPYLHNGAISHHELAEHYYQKLNLSSYIQFQAFKEAFLGYKSVNPLKNDILTIIDFTLPSTEKRMVVVDMENEKILQHTWVSHGRNSGEKWATSFSNKHGSFQSSLGFFLTEEPYMGSNGYSLRLQGLEKGINDQARARAIVIHGADYVSEATIKNTGRLGRSHGCPALPRELNKEIIDQIKFGSLLYIYANDSHYLANTTLLKEHQNILLAERESENSSDSKASIKVL